MAVARAFVLMNSLRAVRGVLCGSAPLTLLTLDTATLHVKMCRWLTSYVPRSQFQVL